MTINAGMIIVCNMFTYQINRERYHHDPQTFYKKITDNLITESVDIKPYA